MPIYEYKCNKCGVVEVMQRITEAPLKKCPNCKSKVERMMSRSSFVLKGTGWYATDYANKGKDQPTASEDSSSSSNGKAKGESQSESKTESKSEAKASTESKPSSSEKTTSAKSAD
ncbi:MAG: zinc ribbon domain-containing protein [Deltaproteobacteria bacterium]|jgi:putative FmdB family regulatory protein|nr:zinc ribbon domain-containing protein [Deltaproteobacteria bacterium]